MSDNARVTNMMSLLEDVEHPEKERAKEINDLRKLALYELLKEKEERIRANKRRSVIRTQCFGGPRNINIYDDTEELKYLLKTFGDPT